MPDLEQSVQIAASPTRVWELVSDVCRMPEWSPQVTSTRLRAGNELGLGAEFTNRNREGELEWTTHAEIVRFVPEEHLSFRIAENWAVWSFRLEPNADGGTILTQTRDTPDGISELSQELTDGFFGGQEPFRATLKAGMQQTLERLKAAAEA